MAARRTRAFWLAALIVIGGALLWIGVPVGASWLAARVTSDSVRGVLLALLAIPATMATLGWALFRLNARYEALSGSEPQRRSPPAWRRSLGEDRSGGSRAGRPRLIDISMTAWAITALVLFLVWFFGFADMRLSPLP